MRYKFFNHYHKNTNLFINIADLSILDTTVIQNGSLLTNLKKKPSCTVLFFVQDYLKMVILYCKKADNVLSKNRPKRYEYPTQQHLVVSSFKFSFPPLSVQFSQR